MAEPFANANTAAPSDSPPLIAQFPLNALLPALLFVPTVALVCLLDRFTFGGVADGQPAMFAFMIASTLTVNVVALFDLWVLEQCPPARAPEIRAAVSPFTFVTVLAGAIWMLAKTDVSDDAARRLIVLYAPALCIGAVILWHTARMIPAMRHRILLGAIFFLASALAEGRSHNIDSSGELERVFIPYSLLLSLMVGVALCIWGATPKMPLRPHE